MSPFRYPGGKSQLYNFVDNLLTINKVSGTYIEPFAGGSGLAIKLLIQNRINNIWINDYDKSIYAVWYSILNNPQLLIDKINDVPFDYKDGSKNSDESNIEYWKKIREQYNTFKDSPTSLDNAFATLFLNRTNRSGIITGGPIGGTKQHTKIYARFNKRTLIKKINLIHSFKDKIKLTNLDATQMIPKIKNETDSSDTFIFFDPPYFDQGSNLYFSSFNYDDHKNMSEQIIDLKKYNWITTYDNVKEIKSLYSKSPKRFEYDIRYTANNYKRGMAKEVMFSNKITKVKSFDKVILTKIKP